MWVPSKQGRFPLAAALLGIALVLWAAAITLFPGSAFGDSRGVRLFLSFLGSTNQSASVSDEGVLQQEQDQQRVQQLRERAQRLLPPARKPGKQQKGKPAKAEAETKEQGGGGQQPKKQQQKKKKQRCAIFNNVAYHIDVAAGMAWAFQEAGCQVTFHIHNGMRGMQDTMEWYHGKYRPPAQILEQLPQYDVVIFITFPEGRNYAPQQLLTLLSSAQHPSQRQLLVVHNPDYLIQNPPISAALLQYAGQPRAAAGAPPRLPPRMQAVVLAPFIAKYTRSLLEAWGRRRSGDKPRFEVPWLPPVVPAAGIDEGVPPSELRHLCIQGTIDPMRRDYAAAFAAACHPAVLAQLARRNESLLLVGSLRRDIPPLEVPPVLQAHVRFLHNLPYQDYYATLTRCRAILTAFPDNDVYLVKKSSSTLAAAIHVGTPLVTEERVIKAYSYLRREAVFAYDPPQGAVERDLGALAAGTARDRAEKEDAEKAAQQQQQQRGTRRRRRRLGEGGEEEEEVVEEPEAGSYASALLRTFQPGAAAAAHEAARSLKAELMQHNAEVAQQFLLETAAWAEAAAAER